MAAAKAWLSGPGQKVGDRVIVCDIGGGTTDFALLRYDNGHFESVPEVTPTGVPLGGNDVDDSILTSLLDAGPHDEESITKRKNGFLIKLRRIKEQLFRQQRQEVPLALGDTALTVKREAIESCAAEFIGRVTDEMKRFLEKCKSVAKAKECPILLVGGGSRLPGLKEAIEAIAPGKVYQWIDSDYATVLGAVNKPAPSGPAAVADSPTIQPTNPSHPDDVPKPRAPAKKGSFADIRNLISDGRGEQAFNIVTKAITQNPSDRLFELWCEVATIMADTEKVLAICREMHRTRKADVWSSCCLADALLTLGRPDEAQRILEPFLNPASAELFPVLCLRWELASESNGPNEEPGLLKKLLALRPNNPTLLARQALTEFHQNHNAAGEQLLKRAETLDTSNFLVAFIGMTVAYAQETKLEALLAKIRPRLAIMERVAPKHSLTRLARAKYLLAAQQHRNALHELDELLHLPDVRGNNSTMAIVYQLRVYCDQALDAQQDLRRDVEEWASRDPRSAEARNFRGNLRLTDKRYAESLDDFNSALEVTPSLADAWVGRGSCLMNLGNYAESLISFESAHRLTPGNAVAMYGATFALVLQVLSKELHGNFANASFYLAPDIPQAKLTNVLQSYAAGQVTEASSIIMLFDNTLWGGAKEGFCISEDKLLAHNLWEDRGFAVRLAQIPSVREEGNEVVLAAEVGSGQVFSDYRIQCGNASHRPDAISAFATLFRSLRDLHLRLDGHKLSQSPKPPENQGVKSAT